LVVIQNLASLELFKLIAISNRKEKKGEKSKKIEKGRGVPIRPRLESQAQPS
jgi:hypothetical protein